MEERRRFPRLNYPCKIIVNSAQEESYAVHTENISPGGLKVILQKNLEINTPLEIELKLGLKNIKCRGRVVWVSGIKSPGTEKPNLFDTGVEFTQIEAEDKKFLSQLIEEILKRS